MEDHDILQKAIAELQSPTFGVTQQFLDIHAVNWTDVTRVRIDKEQSDGTIIVYFPVTQEKFSFAVYLDTVPELAVRWADTIPYASVYFRANSDTLGLNELAALTTLPRSGGWNKGDLRKVGKGTYKSSCLLIEPNPEADEFTDKLNKLLHFLGQDEAGVKRLVEQGGGYIQVAMEFHNGNTMLGGPQLSAEATKKMSQMNLAIDFDLYVGGFSFKST